MSVCPSCNKRSLRPGSSTNPAHCRGLPPFNLRLVRRHFHLLGRVIAWSNYRSHRNCFSQDKERTLRGILDALDRLEAENMLTRSQRRRLRHGRGRWTHELRPNKTFRYGELFPELKDFIWKSRCWRRNSRIKFDSADSITAFTRCVVFRCAPIFACRILTGCSPQAFTPNEYPPSKSI
jgi:hypothetical protein